MAVGSVDAYVASLSGWQAGAVRALRAQILATGAVTEVFKWAEPVYEAGGPVCWIKAHKAHVTFGFWRGAAMRDMFLRLETSGEKMAHLKVRDGEALADSDVAAMVRMGARLNAEFGNPAKSR
jgi:hypothetical protein